jgi:hypothetical protein
MAQCALSLRGFEASVVQKYTYAADLVLRRRYKNASNRRKSTEVSFFAKMTDVIWIDRKKREQQRGRIDGRK